MKRFSLVIMFSLLVMAFGSANAGITLDSVAQLQGVDTIHCGVTVEFHMRLTADVSAGITGSSNGFAISSTDATWSYPMGADVGAVWANDIGIDTLYDGGVFVQLFPSTLGGTGTDTLGFGGFRLFSDGIFDGFDEIFAVIPISVECTETDKVICIDSSGYDPNPWTWATTSGAVVPSWDGPHCFTIGSVGTDVGDEESTLLPEVFALGQNYPNPFNPATTISFDVPHKSNVKISVYNILGQRVSVPVNQEMVAGSHKIEWDAAQEGVSSGVYFFKMEAGDFVKTKKMMLLK